MDVLGIWDEVFFHPDNTYLPNSMTPDNSSAQETIPPAGRGETKPSGWPKKSAKPKKTDRILFSKKQVATLQGHFQFNPYPSSGELISIAGQIGVTARKVRVWFQNKRSKERKLNRFPDWTCYSARPPTPPEVLHNLPSLPTYYPSPMFCVPGSQNLPHDLLGLASGPEVPEICFPPPLNLIPAAANSPNEPFGTVLNNAGSCVDQLPL